jgi:hypothetical protein
MSQGLAIETQAPVPGYGSTDTARDAGVIEGDVAANEGDAGATEGDGAAPEVDAAAVLATIANFAYATSPAFKQITAEPYESAAAADTMISEWVSTSAWYQYIAISPDVTGSQVTLPAGTTIVRAVLDSDGGVGKLTLMFKGPPGYNPALGDWWFGVTDPAGVPVEADGGPEVGLLTGCFSCHIPRANDGYVFGCPLNDRVTAATTANP